MVKCLHERPHGQDQSLHPYLRTSSLRGSGFRVVYGLITVRHLHHVRQDSPCTAGTLQCRQPWSCVAVHALLSGVPLPVAYCTPAVLPNFCSRLVSVLTATYLSLSHRKQPYVPPVARLKVSARHRRQACGGSRRGQCSRLQRLFPLSCGL